MWTVIAVSHLLLVQRFAENHDCALSCHLPSMYTLRTWLQDEKSDCVCQD